MHPCIHEPKKEIEVTSGAAPQDSMIESKDERRNVKLAPQDTDKGWLDCKCGNPRDEKMLHLVNSNCQPTSTRFTADSSEPQDEKGDTKYCSGRGECGDPNCDCPLTPCSTEENWEKEKDSIIQHPKQ